MIKRITLLLFLVACVNIKPHSQIYHHNNPLKPEVIISYDPGTYDNDDFQSFMVNLLEDIAYIQFDKIIIGYGWNMKPGDYEKGLEQFHRMIDLVYAPSLHYLRDAVGQDNDEKDETKQRMFSYPSVEYVKKLICIGSQKGGMEGIKTDETPVTGDIIEILRRADEREVDLLTGGGAIDYIVALKKAEQLSDFKDIKKRLGWIISISDQSMGWDARTGKDPEAYFQDSNNPAHHIRSNSDWIRDRWIWLQKTFNISVHYTREPEFTSFIQENIQTPLNIFDPQVPYLNLFPDRDETYHQKRTGFMGDQPCFWLMYQNGLTDRESPDRGGNLQVHRGYHKWDSTFIYADLGYDHDAEEHTTYWVNLMMKPYFHSIANKVKIIRGQGMNRSPCLILNGDSTQRVMYKSVSPGEKVELSATGTYDPDGDKIYFRWFVTKRSPYAFKGEVRLNADNEKCFLTIPDKAIGKEISIIVQASDLNQNLQMDIGNNHYQKKDGTWMGTSFRRMILSVSP